MASLPPGAQQFPWFGAAIDRTGLTGVKETVEALAREVPSDAVDARLAAVVADVALEQLEAWTIGQIVPRFAASGVPAELLPQRLGNALSRRRPDGGRTSGAEDVAAATLASLQLLPAVGVTTLRALLSALAMAAMHPSAPPVPSDDTVAAIASSGPRHRATLESREAAVTLDDDAIRGLLADVGVIAAWQHAVGAAKVPLLSPQAAVPPIVDLARERIARLTADDVLAADRRPASIATLLDDAMPDDARQREILRDRLFADDRLTLDELGKRFGLTRERVRQLEAVARNTVWRRVVAEDPLASVVRVVAESAGPLQPLDRLLNRFPALRETVDGVGRPAWLVLDRLDDNYEIADGWVASPTVQAAREATRAALAAIADDHGAAPVNAEAVAGTVLAPLRADELRAWLSSCDIPIIGGHALLRARGILDRAAAVLSIAGEPLGSEELLERIDLERSVRSMKNQLSADPRFTSTRRDEWSLAEWGGGEYGSLSRQIGLAVDAAGGFVPLQQLTDDLVNRFGVARSSVAAYASTRGFAVEHGIVHRSALRPLATSRTPSNTRRMYRGGDGWLLRVAVTADHLRGSGFPVPIAVGQVLGLGRRDRVELSALDRPQPVYWNGSQVAIGSIRRFLLAIDAQLGHDVMLRFGADGSFDVTRVVVSGLPPLSVALALVGAPEADSGAVAVERIGTAIAADVGADAHGVLRALERRDDLDVAEALRAGLGLDDPDGASPSS